MSETFSQVLKALIVHSYHNNPELTLRQVRQSYLLDSNRLTSSPVQGSINRSKGTFPEAIAQLL